MTLIDDGLTRRLKDLRRRLRGERFHFVRDYRRLVKALIARHPIDEAMSIAIGGHYAETGELLVDIVAEAGMVDGAALLDLGCGSGRLASALGRRMQVRYLGLDVVPELLAYARTKAPPSYVFKLNRALSLPAEAASFDMVTAFSVFTHLLHEESYLYMRDAYRVLRPGGALVFSFLEFHTEPHWDVFEQTVQATRDGVLPHLNVFIERPAIALWAARIGFEPPSFVAMGETGAAGRLGQSVAVLRKPGGRA